MPLYEFHCQACDGTFEQLCDGLEATGSVRCPECKSRRVSRLLSTFAMSVKGGKSTGSGSACSTCSATSCATCAAR